MISLYPSNVVLVPELQTKSRRDGRKEQHSEEDPHQKGEGPPKDRRRRRLSLAAQTSPPRIWRSLALVSEAMKPSTTAFFSVMV